MHIAHGNALCRHLVKQLLLCLQQQWDTKRCMGLGLSSTHQGA